MPPEDIIRAMQREVGLSTPTPTPPSTQAPERPAAQALATTLR